MEPIRVSELMVSLDEYATVSDDSTLFEALVALEEAQENIERGRDRHRAMLVLDKRGRIVGKMNLWDVLKGVEPRYRDLTYPREVDAYSTSLEYARSLLDTYGLWKRPLEDICRDAAEIIVRDIMHSLVESEYIEEDATLDQAINQLLLGTHQSLLVTSDGDVVGVLRLSDVFKVICDGIRRCRI